jgi:predicted O-methyltransferase YrrM
VVSKLAGVVALPYTYGDALLNLRVPASVGGIRQHDDRDKMMQCIAGQGGVRRVCEVGVFLGEFAETLARVFPDLEELHLVDPFEGILCSGDADGRNIRTVNGREAEALVRAKFVRDPRVRFIVGRSPSALEAFEPESLDLVYVDGDHTYEGCLADLRVAIGKLRPGGWLCGHDYGANPRRCPYPYAFGVRRAVDEFCEERDLAVSMVANDGYMSFAIRVPERA